MTATVTATGGAVVSRGDAAHLLLHFAAEAHRRKWEFATDPAAFDALHRLGNEILAAYRASR